MDRDAATAARSDVSREALIKAKAFVIEDDKDIREIVEAALSRQGFSVECFGSAEAGIVAMRDRGAVPPDVLVLDVMLPGIDGFEALRRLKASAVTASVPVILMTARGEDADIVSGLELGAADYVVKPFSPRVLVARAGAALRRNGLKDAEAGILAVGKLGMDRERHEVTAGGVRVELSATEFDLLELFMRNPGIAFTRSRIIESIKGTGYSVTDRAVDVQVLGLRRKLGDSGSMIETIRGVGYRFAEDS